MVALPPGWQLAAALWSVNSPQIDSTDWLPAAGSGPGGWTVCVTWPRAGLWLVSLADRTISVRGKNVRAHQPGDWILVKTGLGANTRPRSYEFSPHRSRRTRAQTLPPPPCSVQLLSVLTGSVLLVCKLKTIDLSTGLHISHGPYGFKDIC